ncbi:BLOC-2 complex member HPS5 [Polymixia lowei]
MPLLPVVPENNSHVLAEFDCLDPLLSALRLDSGRLKCTCLAVSRKWLALGTSAGGLHLIQKEGWKQRLILTHKEGSITQVACCPHDEDFIAVATSQGLVVVWELQLERRGRPERVSVSWEHRGQSIASLCWDTSTLRVFVGDTGGKVSFLRVGSSKLGKGSAFVMFPVQTITTVDSRVVQLGYQDGRLLVSSLSRCYLCDTEREKFWRVGNKERDGEYGACFFPQSRGVTVGQPPLLYCARPGSRIWEASFSGEVLSTHQFKQLLACPPLPLITYRSEPHFNPAQRSSQSIAFPKLLYLGDQHLLTWTDSAVYIFTPQSGQVLLWSEIKDVVNIAVYRSELFCLQGNGRLSHLSLLSVERCVERLLRRESWALAAAVCCMFQHAIIPSRTRKSIPIDRIDHLRCQLNSTTHLELIGQLEEVITKLEPLDSASSSRRSSISSHESFNVLDCGIYRVISRRGSQSDEETSSLINQSTSEEERLKEFSFGQEEDQVDHDPQSSERMEGERSELGLQFHLPLSFRPKPPRIALQAVKDSVSSFVKKTTEKINTLQMNAELWQRPDTREGGQVEVSATAAQSSEDTENEVYIEMPNTETDLQELRTATERAISQIQDPFVLLDPACLGEALLEWLPVLERVLGREELGSANEGDGLAEERRERDHLKADPEQSQEPPCSSEEQMESVIEEQKEESPELQQKEEPTESVVGKQKEESPELQQKEEPTETIVEEQKEESPELKQKEPMESVVEEQKEESPELKQKEEPTESVIEEQKEESPELKQKEEPTESVVEEQKEESPELKQKEEPTESVIEEQKEDSKEPQQKEEPTESVVEEQKEESPELQQKEDQSESHQTSESNEEKPVVSNGTLPEPVRVGSPKPLPSDMLADLSQLATLYLEVSCFSKQVDQGGVRAVAVTTFLHRYFFLLDQERVRRMCLLCYQVQPELQSSFIKAMLDLTQSSKVVEVIQKGELLKSLRSVRELQPWSAPQLLAHLHRLYEKHGEGALRSFSQFYPTITPADIMAMAQQSHFLAYLDNLVQSRTEDQRLSFLGSLLQPESLRQDWLELALTHDAPQRSDTLTADGQPRWHSHYFSWGYGRLLSLLIRLPADLSSKQKMAETCRNYGYWTGYLYLCCELQRRTEAFSTICQLDDISLLEESHGVVPQTLDEWKLLIQLSQQSSSASEPVTGSGGSSLTNGSADCSRQVSPESLTLRLARAVGPDRALAALEECGVQVALTPHSTLVCELLRLAEKRQRAMIQTMLERCDRFLWSQHA